MSWTGGIFIFEIDTKTSDMMVEIEEQLNLNRGYMKPVHQKICLLENVEIQESYEAAERKISELYPLYGRQCNYGIPFIQSPKSKKIKELEKRIQETKEKLKNYENSHSVSTFKAEFIGCPECKSRLNKMLLRGEKCPLCRTDLRSETTRNTINKYNEKIKIIEKQIREEGKKGEKKGKVCWMVNAEAYIG